MASEERRHVRARIETLLEKASADTLLKTEEFLLERVDQPLVTKNPTGKKTAEPCTKCDGQRPPSSGGQPWHLRKGKDDAWIARGAVCQPCEWVGDREKKAGEQWSKARFLEQRQQWPHWQLWKSLKAEAEEKGEPVIIKIPPVKPRKESFKDEAKSASSK